MILGRQTQLAAVGAAVGGEHRQALGAVLPGRQRVDAELVGDHPQEEVAVLGREPVALVLVERPPERDAPPARGRERQRDDSAPRQADVLGDAPRGRRVDVAGAARPGRIPRARGDVSGCSTPAASATSRTTSSSATGSKSEAGRAGAAAVVISADGRRDGGLRRAARARQVLLAVSGVLELQAA